jgi:hypothetical protein
VSANDFKPGDRVEPSQKFLDHMRALESTLEWGPDTVVFAQRHFDKTGYTLDSDWVAVEHDEPVDTYGTCFLWGPEDLKHCKPDVPATDKHKCHCPKDLWMLQGCQCGGI